MILGTYGCDPNPQARLAKEQTLHFAVGTCNESSLSNQGKGKCDHQNVFETIQRGLICLESFLHTPQNILVPNTVCQDKVCQGKPIVLRVSVQSG